MKTKFIPYILLLLSSTEWLLAQLPQQNTYQQAVDKINCLTIKTLLISYDRPNTARSIETCNFAEVKRGIDKVQENKIKGYKKMFADLANEINGYKNKVANPEEYTLFESSLEELQTLAVRRFEEICEKNKGANNSVCDDMAQRGIKLETEIEHIVGEALAEIGKHTYGGEKAAQRKRTPPPPAEPEKSASNDHEVAAENAPENDTAEPTPETGITPATSTGSSSSSGGSTGIWSVLQTILIVLLMGAVAWLFKENYELKEKMEDIRLLLKILNQRKQ